VCYAYHREYVNIVNVRELVLLRQFPVC